MALYLGIDAGTQSMKGILIDSEKMRCFPPVAVHYGKDLPQYHSPDGFLFNEDEKIRHANPCMWLAALDLLFARMAKAGMPMAEIAGISGSGQQHGSVYLNDRFEYALAHLDSKQSLAEQLQPCFSRATAPIWMDASTSHQCAMLEKQFGLRMREDTGSPATERFTGPQIMKFAAESPGAWTNTVKVHLVSSFMASVLAGKSAPIDLGDGAGMNLLDLRTNLWHTEIAEFTASGLLAKLPPCISSCSVYGELSPYFAKYGFRAGTPLVVWTGDNPASLIGCGGGAADTAVISLGTSDTLFGAMEQYSDAPAHFGHVFGNPAGGFMSLVCFANGSLAREKVREALHLDWDEFNDAAKSAAPGKQLMLPHFVPECTPVVTKPEIRANFDLKSASTGVLARAIMESQALTMRLHAELKRPLRAIRLTGGASANGVFRQIIADVFQAPVYPAANAESAALGAAICAVNACSGTALDVVQTKLCQTAECIKHNPQLAACYDRALAEYATLAEPAR